ncbi:CIA30-domain-containing protein [Aaosphaeria arxii CBS 175.79]|uniref:CIA30-domain-containing protein n=1 Tax=Aaosphaeria arxii CBS 175.79 TaxID=1450172 RepID=A0A6A5Y8R8_9PLEO|nr:CIA30-domain-containing protein [Aaosphaeria arxii CBS 175.79]KAF2021729.1 CIA30-domain-containing protein [Aaosphaeria arxii CBS 175.79]
MQPTARCLAPGFIRRSLDEFKRLSNVALKFEAISTPKKAYPLILFDDEDSLTRCKRMSDKDIGGFSTANFDFVPASEKEPPHARFSGNISIELPKNQPHVQRTGYAGWRTHDQGYTIFGKSVWNVDPYNYLAIHFKSDGRKYFVNVQTESIVHTDIHQHRLHSKTPGEWETILIKWNEFVRTNHGQVVEPQREMLTQKVRTVGAALIDRIQGPYDLSISKVWATNAGPDDEILRNVTGAVSGLPMTTSRQGGFSKPTLSSRKPQSSA